MRSRPLQLGYVLATLAASSAQPVDVAGGSGGTPMFLWGQTLEELVVTIQEPCEEAHGHMLDYKFGVGSAAISCTDADGGVRFHLAFEPREDIVAEKSGCVPKDQQMARTVVCRMQKKYAHDYDRLAARSAPLKKYMDIDWTLFTGVDIRGEGEDPAELAFDEDSPVRTATPDEVEGLMATHKTVYAELSYPWCQQCQPQRENLEKVARLVKKGAKGTKGAKRPDFAIVYIDAREHREFDRRLNFSCSDECNFYLFKKADGGIGQPVAIPAGSAKMEPERILETLKYFAKDMIKTVTAGKANGMFKKAAARLAKGKSTDADAKGFGLFGTAHAELAKLYTDLPARMRDEHFAGTLPPVLMQHHVVHAEELQGHAAPAWVVIRPDGSQTWLDFAELTERAAWDATEEAPRRTWDATEEALSTTLMFWMAAVSKPFCHVLGAGDDYIYDKANVSTMHLFVDPKTDGGQYHPTFYFELAAQYSGRIAFVLRAISQADMTPFGIQKAHQTPSLGLLDYFSKPGMEDEKVESATRPPHYNFGGDVHERADVEEWLGRYVAGTLPVHFRSQKHRRGDAWARGKVRVYTSDEIHSANALAAGGGDVIVALKKSHEEHVHVLESLLIQLADLTKGVEGVVVGAVDTGQNELAETALTLANPRGRTLWGLQMDDDIRSVLGVIPATGDNAGKYLEFPENSDFTLKEVLPWLKENSPETNAHYAEVEAAILADEAERAAEAALDAEKAGLLEAIPVAEYEEGKLKLQVLKNSAYPDAGKPRSGDMVRYHAIAKVSETDVFTKDADEKLHPDDGVRFGAVFQNTRETRVLREVVMGGNDDRREYRGDYIKCIEYGLQHLRVGDRAYLTCHPDLAFGETESIGNEVPANAQTEWDVEIVEIIKLEEEAADEKVPAAAAVQKDEL